jgi:uncharacterized protein YoaH (UPF0181 family)
MLVRQAPRAAASRGSLSAGEEAQACVSTRAHTDQQAAINTMDSLMQADICSGQIPAHSCGAFSGVTKKMTRIFAHLSV